MDKFQRQGIGHQLIQQAITQATDMEVNRFEAWNQIRRFSVVFSVSIGAIDTISV